MKGKINIFGGHSLIAHKMAILRNKKTSSKDFRDLIHEITLIMGSEILKSLEVKEVIVKTPLNVETKASKIADMPFLVSVLRAGLSMEHSMWQLLPNMPSYDVGLKRIEDGSSDVKIEEYLNKLPNKINDAQKIIILDPMIASGTSACHTINLVKERGAKDIIFVGIVCCDTGLERIAAQHPEVVVYCAAKDPKLGSNNYIYPGLGDAGDRYKNTL